MQKATEWKNPARYGNSPAREILDGLREMRYSIPLGTAAHENRAQWETLKAAEKIAERIVNEERKAAQRTR